MQDYICFKFWGMIVYVHLPYYKAKPFFCFYFIINHSITEYQINYFE